MSPSLQDVAERAGVSPSAVSAALRDGPTGNVRLAEATRRRVRRAAAELGYQTNPLARGLRGQATRTVGVLWWRGGPPARQFMARRLARTFQGRGYATYVADHFEDPGHVLAVLGDFARRGVDGVVLEAPPAVAASVKVAAALRAFRAAVVVRPSAKGRPARDLVIHDRLPAIRAAVDHLVARGRRRPLFLLAAYAAEGKAGAFRDALRRHGIDAPDDAVVTLPEDATADSAARAAVDAMEAHFGGCRGRRVPFDAVVGTSDELAVGVLAWLRRRGVRVPDDVALVGANDTDFGPWLDPPLATIDRREAQLAAAVEGRLFERLEHPDAPPTRTHVPMVFIWRASAGGVAPVTPEPLP